MAIDLTDGRPWVLLPGTLCSGAVFDGVLAALGVAGAARRPLAMRHPSVEDYLPELRAACSPGAVVCGFSLGALVAAQLADRLPAGAFVLFGLNPHADDPAKRPDRQALAAEVTGQGGAAAMGGRLPPLYGSDPEGARRLILDMADKTAGDIVAQTGLALSRPDALPALSRCRAPVGLFTGTQDGVTPLALAQTAAAAAPEGRALGLAGLGHYALIEDPAACAAAVLRWQG
ncbi:alpha/beta hydrolase [Marinovum sp.]|uniref:alpha/beta fold hydrolase n=1 Tax=Marinovum sp. TaxID=2024839 RepID=UPI002B278D5D|nr:alpha/beta hydrolase [Marinovum sp.]